MGPLQTIQYGPIPLFSQKYALRNSLRHLAYSLMYIEFWHQNTLLREKVAP